MKKYILLALSLCFITTEANAQFLPPKGLNQQSIINAPNTSLDGKTVTQWATKIDSNSAAAAAAQTTANAAIPLTQKGAASGVAALDENKNVTNNILSQDVQQVFPNMSSSGAAPVLSIGGTQDSYELPGQNADPWINPHSLLLGAQRAGAATSDNSNPDNWGTMSSIVLRGLMDGPDDLGCLMCIANTPWPVYGSRAPLSGTLVDPTKIPSLGSFDSAMNEYLSGTVQSNLTFENVTYDATHIYMPGCGPNATGTCEPLSTEAASHIHANMYVTTNSIDPSIPQHGFVQGKALDIDNTYAALTTGVVSSDGKSISVYGWGVFNGDSYSHPWSATDVPSTTYDTIRNDYGHSEVSIGSPTGTEVENIYAVIDPDSNPASRIRFETLKEWDFSYAASKDNAGTMNGIVMAFGCSGNATTGGACRHPTTDSTALFINGNNLPNGIQTQIPGWGNEYKGYNFYIPGSTAPGTGLNWDFASSAGQGNTHTNFESFTPTSTLSNQLVMRSWTQQFSDSTSTTWEDYSVNLGMVIDGTRWEPSGTTGTHMGTVSFNWNAANLGGVCLINNQNMNTAGMALADPGICVRGDGTMHAGYAATFDSSITAAGPVTINGYTNISGNLGVENGNSLILTPYAGEQDASPYFAANADDTVFLTTSGNGDTATFQSAKVKVDTVAVKDARALATIKTETHSAGDHVWCDNCLNSDQTTGNGTGRWVFLDTASAWRSDDGAVAAD